MRIAVVCPYDIGRPGGVQDQSAKLVTWLRAAGHVAWLVAPGAGGPEGTISVGRARKVRINRSSAPIALDMRVVFRVRDAVSEADVVHVHEPLVPFASLGAVLAEGPPKVGTFHADPSPAVRRAYKLGAPLLRRVLHRLAVVTAVSPVAASALPDGTPYRVIPNAIDLGGFPRVERDPWSAVFVGRDDPRKGLDVLLEAWSRVHREFPSARLTVIGASRAPVPGVEFRGPISDQEKCRIMAGSSIAVAPNTGGESFGIVVAEAMAAGCAVVASDLPAFREVLGMPPAGLLVPVNRADRLAAAITGLFGDREAAGGLQSAAVRRASRFDRSTVFSAYLDAYVAAADGT